MKSLLLIILSLPAPALAQQGTPAPVSQEGQPIMVHLRLPSGWVIAQPSYLYRTLRDARLGRYAHRVRTGAQVVDAANNDSAKGPWLRVQLHNSPDTTIYYLPASALSYKGSAPRCWAIH